MQTLLSVTSRLMEIQQKINIPEFKLPRIAVVGSQSSGKSSVLESIVRRDFLPRGTGIVTRCPLQLTLLNDPTVPHDQEYGEFSHLPGKKFTNFDEIREEIIDRTNQLAGPSKNVVDDPILLTIRSPDVVNLILVDLPGLTQVVTTGQPNDIVQRIESLVTSYISDPSTIILAVSPANVDLANSQAIKTAKQFDPRGTRTLAVMTKIDLVEEGTDIADILNNKLLPLRLGYVGVKLRSQDDIIRNKPLDLALQDEAEFFQSHPAYMEISDRCGTRFLENKLSGMLLDSIQSYLPKLEENLSRIEKNYLRELERCGPPPDEQGNPDRILLSLIHSFVRNYGMYLNGEVMDLPNSPDSAQSSHLGGAKITNYFYEDFPLHLNPLHIDWRGQDDSIRTTIQNMQGYKPTSQPNEKVAERYIIQSLELFRNDIFLLSSKIHTACKEMLSDSISHVSGIDRFPKLRSRILDEAHAMLKEVYTTTDRQLRTFLESQKSYININHPAFIRSEVMRQAEERVKAMQQSQTPSSSSRQSMPMFYDHNAINFFVEYTKLSTDRYFSIIRSHILDMVPKIIVHFLVKASQERLESDLPALLFGKKDVLDLMKEEPQITKRRADLKEKLDYVQQSLLALNEVRYSNAEFQASLESMSSSYSGYDAAGDFDDSEDEHDDGDAAQADGSAAAFTPPSLSTHNPPQKPTPQLFPPPVPSSSLPPPTASVSPPASSTSHPSSKPYPPSSSTTTVFAQPPPAFPIPSVPSQTNIFANTTASSQFTGLPPSQPRQSPPPPSSAYRNLQTTTVTVQPFAAPRKPSKKGTSLFQKPNQ